MVSAAGYVNGYGLYALKSWGNEWQHEKGRLVRNGTPVVVLHSNPDGKAAHWKIKDGKVISLVELPINLADIPEGIYSSISNRVPWLSGW